MVRIWKLNNVRVFTFKGTLQQDCPTFKSSKMFGWMESVPNVVKAAVCHFLHLHLPPTHV